MFKSRDMTQDSFASNGRKRKRNRETLSCLQCRDRKVACDRGTPCSSCVRHKRADDCKYVAASPRAQDRGDDCSTPAYTTPSSRGRSSISNVGHENGTTADNSATTMSAKIKGATQRIRDSADGTASSTSQNVFACGRLAFKDDGASYYIGPLAWTIPAPTSAFYEKNLVWTMLAPQWKRMTKLRTLFRTTHHSTVLTVTANLPAPASLDPLQALIPPDEECQRLVDCFLRTINRLVIVVDPATFRAELFTYFANRSGVEQSWLALLVVILALGLSVSTDPSHPLTVYTTQRMTDLAAAAQQFAFDAGLQTHRPPLRTLQVVLLLVVAKRLEFDWIDGNSGPSGLLAIAQRLVFTMGLHRDPRLANTAMQEAEATFRRKLFMTYVDLEFQHSLDTDMPFLLRVEDFDVQHDKASRRNEYPTRFEHALPVFSRALHMTHSHRSDASETQVRKIFDELREIAENKPPFGVDPGLASSPIEAFETTLTSMFANRLLIGLTLVIFDHASLDFRNRLLTDIFKPAVAVIDQCVEIRKAIDRIAAGEGRDAWMKLLMLFGKTTLFNAVAYLTVVLRRSLLDNSLMALRTPATLHLDSYQLFRKCRAALEDCHCTFTYSFQAIKDLAGFTAYMVAVEQHYRTYVETGEVAAEAVVIRDEKDHIVADAMAKAIESVLNKAETELTTARASLSASASFAGSPDVTGSLGRVLDPSQDVLAVLDQVMDPFTVDSWPWSTLMPGHLSPGTGAGDLY